MESRYQQQIVSLKRQIEELLARMQQADGTLSQYQTEITRHTELREKLEQHYRSELEDMASKLADLQKKLETADGNGSASRDMISHLQQGLQEADAKTAVRDRAVFSALLL